MPERVLGQIRTHTHGESGDVLREDIGGTSWIDNGLLAGVGACLKPDPVGATNGVLVAISARSGR